ncbi:MAG: hypothetical protein U0746_07420 [Gemmataceae bacterium]
MIVRFYWSIACLGMAITPAAHAQIVGYDFFGAAGNQLSTSATLLASNLTAGAISRGAGISADTLTNSINARAFVTGGFDPTRTDYYTFTITPNAGYQLNLNQVSIVAPVGSAGPTSLTLYNATGGAVLGTALALTQGATTSASYTFSLTTAAAIELRLYGTNASNNGANSQLGFLSTAAGKYGVAIGGSVTPVPEAQTYAFAGIGLGLVGFGYLRRRQAAAIAI